MRIKISNLFYLILGLIGFKAAPAVAADNIFLCGDGLQGESQSVNYQDCMDVIAWSWGAAMPIPTGTVGSDTGRPQFQELAITKSIDKTSPVFMSHTTAGTVFPKMSMYVDSCSLDCANSAYYKLRLQNVRVSSVSIGGTAGESRPTEHISLNYEKITWCYTPQGAKDIPGVEICEGWDLINNSSYP